jgi:alkylation response protein AidB-like acyl-CoA dehydrogenase
LDFTLKEHHNHFTTVSREFAKKEMLPFAPMWDETHFFPKDVLKKAATLGFASIPISADYGGVGGTRFDAALVFEQLSRACPSTTAYLSIHTMVSLLIERFGNEDQKKHWLPSLATLDLFSSYCLTEPNAGSDAASLKTTAKKQGTNYILKGTKAFISGGSASDVYLVMARTGDETHKGISCFLVEKETKGLSFGKLEKKMGWNSQPTCMVFFDDCCIPEINRIGVEGEGFKIALSALDGGRVNIAACSLGGAFEVSERAKKYSSEREQFKKRLQDFQNTQFRLADMYTNLEAAKLMVYRAACVLDQGDSESTMYAAMAKRLATDSGFEIANQALQIHGGYGYLKEYDIERYVRDLRVHQILEGTNEIMRLVIAKRILGS